MEISEMLKSMMLDGWQFYLSHNGLKFYVRAEHRSGKEWLSNGEIFFDAVSVIYNLYERALISNMQKS
jgi:hypothetical protein